MKSHLNFVSFFEHKEKSIYLFTEISSLQSHEIRGEKLYKQYWSKCLLVKTLLDTINSKWLNS